MQRLLKKKHGRISQVQTTTSQAPTSKSKKANNGDQTSVPRKVFLRSTKLRAQTKIRATFGESDSSSVDDYRDESYDPKKDKNKQESSDSSGAETEDCRPKKHNRSALSKEVCF